MDALLASQPETGVWLSLVVAALDEANNPAWERAAATVQLRPAQPRGLPLLAVAVVAVDRAVVEAWVGRMLARAGSAQPAVARLAGGAGSSGLDGVALLEAAINQDAERMVAIASTLGIEANALEAVAQLAAMPLLQASRRRFAAAVPVDWDAGFCPICGAWPVLAESRGLERARRPRCGRCGGDWIVLGARCIYCGRTDHADLASLVSETDSEARRVETCARCRGYLKTVATLRAWAGDEVVLADLATIDLDLVALERDYHRPERPALSLSLRLVDALDPAAPAAPSGAL
jgi:FdhE protein